MVVETVDKADVEVASLAASLLTSKATVLDDSATDCSFTSCVKANAASAVRVASMISQRFCFGIENLLTNVLFQAV